MWIFGAWLLLVFAGAVYDLVTSADRNNSGEVK